MERLIQLTEDGSHTVAIPNLHVTYHSIHGAVQESRHVYIETGLCYFINNTISTNTAVHILEIGFGTGLNAILSLDQAVQQHQKIHYTAIEPYPLSGRELQVLNYKLFMPPAITGYFYALHDCT